MKKRYLAIALVILSFISLFIGVSNISIKDILAGDSSKMQIIAKAYQYNNCWYGTKYKWSYNAADK